MKMTKTLIAAATIAAAGSTVSAGGLAPAVVAPMVDVVVMEPKGSINSGYVVLGVLGALLVASGSF